MEWIFWHLLNNQSAGVWRWLFLNLKIREFVEYTHFSAVTQMLATFSPRNGHNRHSLLSRHTTRYKLMQNVNHIPCSFSWRNFASRSACVFYRLSGGIGPATWACLLFGSTSPAFLFKSKTRLDDENSEYTVDSSHCFISSTHHIWPVILALDLISSLTSHNMMWTCKTSHF